MLLSQKTSQLISRGNQLTDFYMVGILDVNNLTVGWLTKLYYYVFLLSLIIALEVIFLIIKFNLIFSQFASNYCSNYSWAIGSSKKSRIIVNVLDLNLRFWFVFFFIYRNQKKIGIFQAKFHLSRVHLFISLFLSFLASN